MATISATLVKDLRDKTGAGMMDCKAALNETDGDMEGAIDWLRAKGLSKAAKKAGRVAAEGLIGLGADAKEAALVEVNSETDFVARNDTFQTCAFEQVSSVFRDIVGRFGRRRGPRPALSRPAAPEQPWRCGNCRAGPGARSRCRARAPWRRASRSVPP